MGTQTDPVEGLESLVEMNMASDGENNAANTIGSPLDMNNNENMRGN